MEFPLLFALVMLVVAVAMIWGARNRSRQPGGRTGASADGNPTARSNADGSHGGDGGNGGD